MNSTEYRVKDMIIDFHTHTFPDFLAPKVIPKLEAGANMHAALNGTFDMLSESMDIANVDISVLQPVATTVSQVITCNNCAQVINEEHSERFLSFGAMHPDFENYREELQRIRNMGIKGIKLHPDYQKVMIDDIRYKRIIAAASELGFIILIHAGIDVGLPGPVHAVPQAIKNLLVDVKPEKIVLAHMGGFNLWEEAVEVLAGEDVYIDTAFSLGVIDYFADYPMEKRNYTMMNEALFMKAVNAFGEDKVLFATDSPWAGQAETLKVIGEMPLSEVQKRKILSENARRLLNL